MKTIFEKQGVEYHQAGNYMLANVGVSEQKEYQIGVWANRHRHYLKHHHRIRYYNLLTSEKLYPYLADIEEQAENMFQGLVKSLAEQENITEKMKAFALMEWVRKMNNIRNSAAEIVNTELIFK